MKINPITGNSHTVSSLLHEITENLSRHCPETPRLDAEVLVTHVLKTDKINLYLYPDNPVSDESRQHLNELISRREKGEPVAYLIGRKEFWSLTFKVSNAVMIPRPQTETLIEAALKIFSAEASPSVLELGTGSGAISIALSSELPRASIIAIDISPDALSIARQNASDNGIDSITFRQGNLYEPVKTEGICFDLIVSNPPYIPTDDIRLLPAGIRDYEPYLALDGGYDGLKYYRKIVEGALRYLKSGGFLLLEVGYKQSRDVCNVIAQTQGFSSPETVKDLLNIERVVKTYRV